MISPLCMHSFESLCAMQVQVIYDLLKPTMLRQLRADVGSLVIARVEVQIPVAMTELQAEAYRKVLGRFYDVLADPKIHRLSSTRASNTKTICDELRKVRLPLTITQSLSASLLDTGKQL